MNARWIDRLLHIGIFSVSVFMLMNRRPGLIVPMLLVALGVAVGVRSRLRDLEKERAERESIGSILGRRF